MSAVRVRYWDAAFAGQRRGPDKQKAPGDAQRVGDVEGRGERVDAPPRLFLYRCLRQLAVLLEPAFHGHEVEGGRGRRPADGLGEVRVAAAPGADRCTTPAGHLR